MFSMVNTEHSGKLIYFSTNHIELENIVKNAHNMGLSSQPPIKKKKINTVHNLITFSIVFTKKIFFFFWSKNFMNLYSKTFYILNFQKKKKFMVK